MEKNIVQLLNLKTKPMRIEQSASNYLVLKLHTEDVTVDMSSESAESLLDMISKLYAAVAYKLWDSYYDWDKANEAIDDILWLGIKKLQHHLDSTVWLWATDRPDLIPDDLKDYFFRIK